MSSYYENNTSWAAQGRTPSWEQQAPPSRSGTASASRDETVAFSAQFEEIDRATDNLVKSGKWMAGMPGQGRRESMPMMGRGGPDSAEPRSSAPPSRHHSVSEYDGARSSSAAGLQGYYANQRFQPRQNEAEQMMQAKRRMAAQRERELRNYHQEQQYNRNIPGVKSDRSQSPNTGMSEDERRELIARQHRALYGNESAMYPEGGAPSNSAPRRQSQDVRVGNTAGRGASPLAFDPFGSQQQSSAEGAVQMPPREGMPKSPNSASSPSSNPTNFSLIDNAAQSSHTSVSSPGGSPPLVQGGKQSTTAAGSIPIGTRPAQAPAGPPGLNKRSTTPLASSPLNPSQRSTSAASNPAVPGLGASWGPNNGGWGGSKNTLGVQASVWG